MEGGRETESGMGEEQGEGQRQRKRKREEDVKSALCSPFSPRNQKTGLTDQYGKVTRVDEERNKGGGRTLQKPK